ncbi:alpha/beta fold hydrolase [Nocardiopsis composta]|uniref:Pimeloyl-ACP methyl ester carboxylesterase n=1 Tax=Nocardiopsis composta TaxID=157465 RepID=A0A7W8QI38_9ACTN|nr:alpha/beta hydrolase [Nocardiopsis composta]MBB5430786.1 pimeloyl-ACP methyl ester carboxylesterase [Nocardiopsis composta]
METTIDLDGVRTWYAEEGTGEPLVLMHGGLSDARYFGLALGALAERFRVLTPERRGHGHTPDVEGPYTVDALVGDAAAFLEKVAGGPAHLVAYSQGANLAMHLAARRPDLVSRLVLVSGAAEAEGFLPGMHPSADSEPPAVIADMYAEVSPDGREHFPVVVEKMVGLFEEPTPVTAAHLASIRARTLVMAGDDDIIRPEHTRFLYESIPGAELAVVPGTSHVLFLEKPDLCARLVLDFLTEDPVPTMMPIHRAGA